MKKLTLLLGLSLALFFGCKKENNSSNPAAPAVQNQSSALHRVTFDRNGITSVTIADANLLQIHPKKENNPAFTSGAPHQAIATLDIGGFQDTSNVISNSGGVHGHITWHGQYDLQMDAVCLQVIGNEGICSGTITSVTNDGGFPFVFAVGNTILFKVKDNGEGSKYPADQINSALFYWDQVFGPFPCGADFSLLPWDIYLDILPGGQIQVK